MLAEVLPEAGRTLLIWALSDTDPLLERGDISVRAMAGDEEVTEWDRFRDQHPMGRAVYPMYSTEVGWRPVRLGYFRGGKLSGGLLLVVRKVSNLPFSAGRILCAMLGPSDQAEMLDDLLEAVDRFSIRNAVMETELQLRIPANDVVPGFSWWSDAYRVLTRRGYQRLPRVDRTYFVRIDRPDDKLLASFGQQPRNRIKKAIKDGAKIEVTTDASLLELFYNSYVGTTERKNVRGQLPRQVIVNGLAPLLSSGRAQIFAEKYGDAISNMLVVDPLGQACAMLASRTRDNVEGKVPGCAQLMHFTAMKAMRDKGHVWYDFGGCEGPVPVESHPNYGVWHFKHAFKGEYVTFLPSMRKIRGDITRSILTLVHRHRGDAVSIS